MQIKDIVTLPEVAEKYNIPIRTLQGRLKKLIENVDYKKFGKRNATILTPEGVKKIIK